MKFPDCSPNFHPNYISDSKKMFSREEIFINLWIKSLNASHIVMIEKFYENPEIKEILKKMNYEKVLLIIN